MLQFIRVICCVFTLVWTVFMNSGTMKIIVPYVKIKHLLHIHLVYTDQGSGIHCH